MNQNTWPPLSLLTSTSLTVIILLLISPSTILFPTSTTASAAGDGICYKSIISFGDSLADTGNLLRLSSNNHPPPNFFFPPYGDSYFHHPAGRCSDGRLVVDFIAESLGLPLLPPYLAGKDGGYSSSSSLDEFRGVNFAVAGATALDDAYFRERGIHNPVTNISLGDQLLWFKDMLHSFCLQTSSGCSEMLRSSLVLVGEIGGNDYNHPLQAGTNIEAVKSFVIPVIRTIGSAIEELIELGAVTLVVPGNFPIGCSAVYLTHFGSSSNHLQDYDSAGCLKWLNDFSKYHNDLLQIELNRIRNLHPHATIIYADYYNAAMRMYQHPQKYGFKRALPACCGGGGAYNYNSSVICGYEVLASCEDPSSYICWDGLHLTEAAYGLIAQGLLQGPYSVPPINALSCISEYLGQQV